MGITIPPMCGHIDDTHILKERLMNMKKKIELLEKKIKTLQAEMKSGGNKNHRIMLKIYTEKLEQLKKELI